MKLSASKHIAALAAALAFAPTVGAQERVLYETPAPRAFMIDADTGTVLFSKGAEETFSPASLAKLSTMETVAHVLQDGKATGATEYFVSEHAWRTGGAPSRTATMFAVVKSNISVDNLIQGLSVVMANDAAIILAEGVAGTESAFSELMNERAKSLGLAQSRFVNPTGLPAPGQTTSARDMALLAMHLWQDHRVLYSRYAQKEFGWNNITQQNRNPLIKQGIGIDGLVTGFAEGEGYSIVVSGIRDGRRLFAALAGLPNDKDRLSEAIRIIDWGMTSFRNAEIFANHEPVGQASVFGGEKGRLNLVANGPVSILAPTDGSVEFVGRIIYPGPVEAPVKQGAEIGKLVIYGDKQIVREIPLYAGESIATGSIAQRALGAVYELAFGWLRGLSLESIPGLSKGDA